MNKEEIMQGLSKYLDLPKDFKPNKFELDLYGVLLEKIASFGKQPETEQHNPGMKLVAVHPHNDLI